MVDTPLHQSFYKSLHFPDTGMTRVPAYTEATARYRRMMRDADRFVLDNRAVETILERGTEIEHLMDRTQIAHLPFNTVWLEYDNLHKTRYAQKLGIAQRVSLEDCPPRMGFLVERINERPDAWIAFRIMDNPDKFTLPFHGIAPMAYLFDAGSLTPISRLGRWGAYTPAGIEVTAPEEITDLMGKIKGIDRSSTIIGQCIWGIEAHSEYDQFDEVNNIASISLEPIWETAATNRTGADSLWADVFAEAMVENVGVMRFLITALASINHVPIVYESPKGRPGAFLAQGRMRPYFSHRTVSIDFSRIGRKSISRLLAEAATQARRAAHKVRRYRRMIRDEMGTIIGVKWIEAHTRGDPRLGWVHHDYEATDSA